MMQAVLEGKFDDIELWAEQAQTLGEDSALVLEKKGLKWLEYVGILSFEMWRMHEESEEIWSSLCVQCCTICVQYMDCWGSAGLRFVDVA